MANQHALLYRRHCHHTNALQARSQQARRSVVASHCAATPGHNTLAHCCCDHLPGRVTGCAAVGRVAGSACNGGGKVALSSMPAEHELAVVSSNKSACMAVGSASTVHRRRMSHSMYNVPCKCWQLSSNANNEQSPCTLGLQKQAYHKPT